MSRDSYMPATKVGQVQWAKTFNDVVGAATAAYGVQAPMMTQFEALNATLQGAWLISETPATRTRGTIETRNQCLKNMRALAHKMVSIIQGTETVTPQMLIDAGLTVRKTHGTPIGVPTQKPVLVATKVDGRRVTIELRQDVNKRSKPAGVAGATVLTATTATESTDRWKFATNTTRTKVTITFPASSTGDTVYIAAFWWNERGESGPASDPLTINLPAGGVVMTEETGMPILKAA